MRAVDVEGLLRALASQAPPTANDCAIVDRRLSREETAADETPVGEPERSEMSDIELPVDGPTDEGESAAPAATADAGTRAQLDEPERSSGWS